MDTVFSAAFLLSCWTVFRKECADFLASTVPSFTLFASDTIASNFSYHRHATPGFIEKKAVGLCGHGCNGSILTDSIRWRNDAFMRAWASGYCNDSWLAPSCRVMV